MTAQGRPSKLDVTAAIEHGALRGTTVLHRAGENPTIDSIALVSRPEQARRVAPRAAVVIAAGQETSGWLVSSVLRFAWERRASVIVAAGVQPDSVLVLARRLGITLLSTDGDPTTLALALAADIGAANAAVEAQLVAMLRVVMKERTVDGVLRATSAELGGLPLELAFRGSVVAASGVSAREGTQELGPYRVADATDDQVSLSAFPLRSAGETGYAESAIELMMPCLRAVWLESESADRLDGLVAAAIVAEESPTGAAATPVLVGQLGWRDDESHFVVFLTPAMGRGSRALTNVVRLLWRRAMGRGALTETTGGWLAVLTADDENGTTRAIRRLTSALSPSLTELGIGIGVSRVETAADRLQELVVEARLAARCAWAARDGQVASFAELELSAIGYLFDPVDARTIAALVLPELCAAPDLDKLLESVGSFLEHGSVSAAAADLSIHRNTLTARLERARALGLPVGEATSAFAVTAVVRALAAVRHSDG